MNFEHNENRQVFIEMTNRIHGGPGWELGTCLWSPEKGRGTNKEAWSTMKMVRKGDLIIHSVKTSKGHMIIGTSTAESECSILDVEPIIPGEWGGRGTYYKIELENYQNFKSQIPMQDFLNEKNELLKGHDKGSFFTRDLKPAQKYLIALSEVVKNVLLQYLFQKDIKIDLNEETEGTNLPVRGNQNPEKKASVVIRTVRDTKLVRELKSEMKDKCQICGKRIYLGENKFYSEGHHLQPLGGESAGPDVKENIMILCPCHHTEFDYGVIAVDPKTLKIVHSNPEDEFNGKDLNYQRDDLGQDFIKYHYNKRFNKINK